MPRSIVPFALATLLASPIGCGPGGASPTPDPAAPPVTALWLADGYYLPAAAVQAAAGPGGGQATPGRGGGHATPAGAAPASATAAAEAGETAGGEGFALPPAEAGETAGGEGFALPPGALRIRRLWAVDEESMAYLLKQAAARAETP